MRGRHNTTPSSSRTDASHLNVLRALIEVRGRVKLPTLLLVSELLSEGVVMRQQGQVFMPTSRDEDGAGLWEYRYRFGGRDAKRMQQSGFTTEDDARAALGRALETLRRAIGTVRTLTLAKLVEQYLAQLRTLRA